MENQLRVVSEPIGRPGRYDKRQWTVPKALMEGKTASDIMMENGYHPAGYGQPFDETSDEQNFYFKSWNSCD